MGSYVGKPINNLGQKQIKTFLGIFKACIGNTPTINELYRYVWLLENPEESWRAIIKENKDKYKYSLLPEMRGAYF